MPGSAYEVNGILLGTEFHRGTLHVISSKRQKWEDIGISSRLKVVSKALPKMTSLPSIDRLMVYHLQCERSKREYGSPSYPMHTLAQQFLRRLISWLPICQMVPMASCRFSLHTTGPSVPRHPVWCLPFVLFPTLPDRLSSPQLLAPPTCANSPTQRRRTLTCFPSPSTRSPIFPHPAKYPSRSSNAEFPAWQIAWWIWLGYRYGLSGSGGRLFLQ